MYIFCVSDMFHKSIILSLKIVESFDLVASDFKLWKFLTMDFKVQSVFSDLQCASYE